MPADLPEILVYTQAYNAEKTLARTIESVLSQTFGNFIYLVYNNGSTDNTDKIIAEYMAKDKRIITRVLLQNNREAVTCVVPAVLSEHPHIQWVSNIDADDELKPTFLSETYSFATQNNLQLVATGYEKVDEINGSILKIKSAANNFILYGDSFRTAFIEYRGFAVSFWGKLINSRIVIDVFKKYEDVPFCNFLDAAFTLECYAMSSKAGIIGESLFRYYQSPNTSGKQFHPNRVESDWFAFEVNRNYLLGYGEIDDLNMDFLYAIQLSFIEETLGVICSAPMPSGEKIRHMVRMFEHQTAKDTLVRKADPRFRNLAARAEFVQRVKDWVNAHEGVEQYREETKKLFNLLDTVN